MIYTSTRGSAAPALFEDVLLSGLAPDGGLYMPTGWPALDAAAFDGAAYNSVAATVMAAYTGDNPDRDELAAIIADAYSNFGHPDTAPLTAIGENLYLLELFHGPTLAFKDFAMQVLARLMERALTKRGARTTILGATSGDTGAAAVEAFRGRKDIEIFILFPHGRISNVQRRQMTTAAEGNVHAIAIEGTFDDCQAHVKALFGDEDFRHRQSLSAINSINWARIIAQAVYYFTAAAKIPRGKPPIFSVPTGNFGDIFAGFVASRMGLPLERLVIATNENDILVRALMSGRYEPKTVLPTDSPSMDIQISSNFERLLFEACGCDASRVRQDMADLRDHGGFDIEPNALRTINSQFAAHRVSRAEAAAAMKSLLKETGVLCDPHTAVGLAAAKKDRDANGLTHPMIVLATAHPAKFPDAVNHATGHIPEVPESLYRCLEGKERYQVLPNSASAIADYIDANAFASRPN